MASETERAMSSKETLADLTDAERQLWHLLIWPLADQRSVLAALAAERRTVRELRAALSGKTMHDAAAVEREAIIALVEEAYRSGWWRDRIAPHLTVGREVLGILVARIRARGDDGGGA